MNPPRQQQDDEYNKDLCDEKHSDLHRSINWRSAVVASLFGVAFACIGTLFLLYTLLPKEAPPQWFKEQVNKLETNQHELEKVVTSNQQAIVKLQVSLDSNSAVLEHNNKTLERIEQLMVKMDGGGTSPP